MKDQWERVAQERVVAAVRSSLGERAFTAAWTAGKAMDVEQATACARGSDRAAVSRQVFAQDAFFPVTSNFNNDDEGWTARDKNFTPLEVSYVESGGDPFGHICITAGLAEGAYLLAPAKYLGDQSG